MTVTMKPTSSDHQTASRIISEVLSKTSGKTPREVATLLNEAVKEGVGRPVIEAEVTDAGDLRLKFNLDPAK